MTSGVSMNVSSLQISQQRECRQQHHAAPAEAPRGGPLARDEPYAGADDDKRIEAQRGERSAAQKRVNRAQGSTQRAGPARQRMKRTGWKPPGDRRVEERQCRGGGDDSDARRDEPGSRKALH